MDQTPERHDTAATEERRVLTVEEILDLYTDFKVVGEFAGTALDDGAVKQVVDRLMLTHMKRGNSVIGSFCVNADSELRYIVFAKEREVDLGNILGGIAIGVQRPHRY